ncbi:hypothetical protein C7S16_2470 [Burkholderia thailandensis]|uniref:Uncharacterized protein n=1 Tax=Burkholderia thailandensis TaxID=57975 RepID=A0AAW9CYV2_BURTH|nr:conserved hypothetical protein [Burkholderia pseudomallei 305]MDW9240236.1 hypothetical protein [Burkholderia thailandensis]MDW9255327.1 hypothetical protein [Burkholderia thailandensis]
MAFPYKGRMRQVGERIEVEQEQHVALLRLLGKIRDVAPKRSTYKRRDMRPGD